jgi:signal transduction histidine kinase
MRFLNNIAQLISESFGRTVRLVERGRLATVGELASAIAHELRTPLATMSLALDYFARQQQPPNARKRLELAGGEAARMGRLLDDMLLYAKPLSLTLAPLSPSALAADAVELAAGQACCGARRIELRADPEATRCTVLGDRDRLLQVLINLLRNACEAAPPDSAVTVTLGRGVGDPAGGPVLIDIHNTGEPIPEPILRRAFQPFVSAKRGGTGLGLAIVHRLVQAHGGEVTLSSSEAAGTHARVTLPSPPEVAAERGRETGGEGPTQPDPAPAGARGP